MSKEIRFAVGPGGTPIQVDTLNTHQSHLKFISDQMFTILWKEPPNEGEVTVETGKDQGNGKYDAAESKNKGFELQLKLNKALIERTYVDYTVEINGKTLDPRVDW